MRSALGASCSGAKRSRALLVLLLLLVVVLPPLLLPPPPPPPPPPPSPLLSGSGRLFSARFSWIPRRF